EFLVLTIHFVIQRGGLDGPDAALPPFRDGHFFDEIHFDFGLRLEMSDVGIEHSLETGDGLVGEDHGLEAMPWRSELSAEARSPSGVVGPRLLAPLAREACMRCCEDMVLLQCART